jgi:hypothetical protein
LTCQFRCSIPFNTHSCIVISTPFQTQKILLELPDSVFERLQETIERVVSETLQKHVEAILAEPAKLTRAEVCKRLRITPPTLRKLEQDGRLIPERVGRRVLYDGRKIEMFLNR